MRKDLQKRVLVVSALLERLAVSADPKAIAAQIAKISEGIRSGTISADKIGQASQMILKLNQQLAQLSEQSAGANLGNEAAGL